MNITANNVVLDCQGHKIEGIETVDSYGIYGEGVFNITIKNCGVEHWFFGAHISGGGNIQIINSTFETNYIGIDFTNTSNNTIMYSTINYNDDTGIWLRNSSYNRIMFSHFDTGSEGILVDTGDHNQIINSTFSNYNFSLFLQNSSYNIIINSTFSTNEYDIYIPRGSYNQIINSTFKWNEKESITIGHFSHNNQIINSTFYGGNKGIKVSSKNNTIINSSFEHNYYGIHFVSWSSHNRVINSNFKDNLYYGIYFEYSHNNTITNSSFAANDIGIHFEHSYNNTLAYSVLEDCISLYNSSYNRIINTTVTEYIGIYLGQSNYNQIINSTFLGQGGSDGLKFEGSNNNTVINSIIRNYAGGLYLYNSSYNRIINTTSDSNTDGIDLRHNSNYNQIINSVISNTLYGFYINNSTYNQIINSTIRNNTCGIQLVESSNNNTIHSNIIQDNSYGIHIANSVFNLIYNNLFNNSDNVWVGDITNYWNTTYQVGTNIWNASLGYIGGNLWTNPSNTGFSDNCTDADFDGFCDSPYVLATNNIDYLPIAKQVGQVGPTYLTITFNYNQVNFGTLSHNTLNPAPNQTNGIYNVTVDTNANYKVYARGYDFTGPASLSISNLYFDTNETASNLAYGDAISLLTSNQLIDTNIPYTYTTNYHGYWLNIPYKQRAGTYNTTVIITYANV